MKIIDLEVGDKFHVRYNRSMTYMVADPQLYEDKRLCVSLRHGTTALFRLDADIIKLEVDFKITVMRNVAFKEIPMGEVFRYNQGLYLKGHGGSYSLSRGWCFTTLFQTKIVELLEVTGDCSV